MKCIYEIKYDVQWESRESKHWEPRVDRVFAGPDALEGVAKIKERALAERRLDDNGRQDRCIGFRLREVLLLAEAEF